MIGGFGNELEALNEDYFKFILTGTPFVTAKYAMTADGNIAAAGGDSKWISCEASREWVHRLRNRTDAILVGAGTVLRDDPKLNVRIPGRTRDPLRIVIDPDGVTPPKAQVLTDEGRTLFVVPKNAPAEFLRLCESHGKEVLAIDFPFRYPDLLALLARDHAVESLLIEGGGRTFHAALKDDAIDKLAIFIAPKILGGKGIQPFEGEGAILMQNALKLSRFSVENIGEDLLIQGYLHESRTGEKIFGER